MMLVCVCVIVVVRGVSRGRSWLLMSACTAHGAGGTGSRGEGKKVCVCVCPAFIQSASHISMMQVRLRWPEKVVIAASQRLLHLSVSSSTGTKHADVIWRGYVLTRSRDTFASFHPFPKTAGARLCVSEENR